MQFGTLVNRPTIAAGSARRAATAPATSRKATVALWTVQGLLAATFLIAGASKLVMPADQLTQDSDFAASFLRFIGVVEVLGAVGVILPALLRVRPMLTPLAAAGLVIVMAGAVVSTVVTMGMGPALFPLVVGAAAAFVIYGRTHLAPVTGR
jgi:hypothetical protein